MPWKLTNSSPASRSEHIVRLSHHPASLITNFAKALDGNAKLELSYYKYRPQSLLDERRTVRVRAADFDTNRIAELLNDLKADEELAFHSSILLGTRRHFHIPLIDFCGRLNAHSLTIIEETIDHRLFERLFIYDSGRSYHGYILRPLSHSEWVRFMGTLLLMNLPAESPISDSRWIGHRLRAGYASLRWSKNTSHYLSLPTQVTSFKPP